MIGEGSSVQGTLDYLWFSAVGSSTRVACEEGTADAVVCTIEFEGVDPEIEASGSLVNIYIPVQEWPRDGFSHVTVRDSQGLRTLPYKNS